ncbi:MAG: NAD(P)-dependent alcohol dehydrogenase [Bacteroidota bacterium]
MKAFTIPHYGNTNVLNMVEIPIPEPKDDEVLIKVKSTSINDWDLGLVEGSPFVIRLLYGLRRPKYNIPGTEAAGIVEKIGAEVKQFVVGDEVFGDLSESGFGGFAEYVCVKENALIKKPHMMTFDQATAIPHAAELAQQGLIDLGKLDNGQKVLINGAGGGVGTLGVQIARELKIHITGVDHGHKLSFLKSIGFDEVIDYTKEDFTKRTEQYDLILDTKTNRPISHYARALKKGGKYVTVGGSMSRIIQISLLGPLIHLFTQKRFNVLGLKPNKDLKTINDLFIEGQLQPLLEGPFSFDQIPQLLQYFKEGKHMGKIVIQIS